MRFFATFLVFSLLMMNRLTAVVSDGSSSDSLILPAPRVAPALTPVRSGSFNPYAAPEVNPALEAELESHKPFFRDLSGTPSLNLTLNPTQAHIVCPDPTCDIDHKISFELPLMDKSHVSGRYEEMDTRGDGLPKVRKVPVPTDLGMALLAMDLKEKNPAVEIFYNPVQFLGAGSASEAHVLGALDDAYTYMLGKKEYGEGEQAFSYGLIFNSNDGHSTPLLLQKRYGKVAIISLDSVGKANLQGSGRELIEAFEAYAERNGAPFYINRGQRQMDYISCRTDALQILNDALLNPGAFPPRFWEAAAGTNTDFILPRPWRKTVANPHLARAPDMGEVEERELCPVQVRPTLFAQSDPAEVFYGDRTISTARWLVPTLKMAEDNERKMADLLLRHRGNPQFLKILNMRLLPFKKELLVTTARAGEILAAQARGVSPPEPASAEDHAKRRRVSFSGAIGGVATPRGALVGPPRLPDRPKVSGAGSFPVAVQPAHAKRPVSGHAQSFSAGAWAAAAEESSVRPAPVRRKVAEPSTSRDTFLVAERFGLKVQREARAQPAARDVGSFPVTRPASAWREVAPERSASAATLSSSQGLPPRAQRAAAPGLSTRANRGRGVVSTPRRDVDARGRDGLVVKKTLGRRVFDGVFRSLR